MAAERAGGDADGVGQGQLRQRRAVQRRYDGLEGCGGRGRSGAGCRGGADNKHRVGHCVQGLVGDAAHYPAGDAAAPVGAHYHQGGGVGAGPCHDDIGRRAALGGDGHGVAVGFQPLAGGLQAGFGVLAGGLFQLARDGAGAGAQESRGQDVKGLHQFNGDGQRRGHEPGVGQSLLGEFGTIQRNDYFGVHRKVCPRVGIGLAPLWRPC